ncbi:MAG: hypothetical protein Q7R67_02765 [bacterium]|nr:hypothetical protein [bacterium]
MAHFEEVLARVEREEGVKIQRLPHSIVARFPTSISRYSLVTLMADIMSSEELPFNGTYAITNDGEDIILHLDNHPTTEKLPTSRTQLGRD